MLRSNGKRNELEDAILTDEEFIEIQQIHYGRKTDPAAKARSEKSLNECEDATLWLP